MAAQDRSWISYKNNQLILYGVVGLFSVVGIAAYYKYKANLFQTISDAIGAPADNVNAGLYGDWRDLYAGDFWNPQTYLARKDVKQPTIDHIAAGTYAKAIYDSIGLTDLTSNQEAAVAIFKKLGDRADLAMVADRFSTMNNRTLVDYLKSHFEGALTHKNYVQEIYDIVKTLPI